MFSAVPSCLSAAGGERQLSVASRSRIEAQINAVQNDSTDAAMSKAQNNRKLNACWTRASRDHAARDN
jgi:hypothetical protein